MKAISLWQPWATAICLGRKLIETRSWSTPYRGPLAIHAAKKWGWEQGELLAQSCINGDIPMYCAIPRGAIVAVAELVAVQQIDEALIATLSAQERRWGDYRPGRYAWLLADVRRLPEPIEYRGAQGLFEVPDELLTVGGVAA